MTGVGQVFCSVQVSQGEWCGTGVPQFSGETR